MPGPLVTNRGLVKHPTQPGLVLSPCPECCGSRCWIPARWCCDPSREAWFYRNSPECEGYFPGLPTVPLDRVVTVSIGRGTCWVTEPSRASNAFPPGALTIPPARSLAEGGCGDTAQCLDCPDCCDVSDSMPCSNGPTCCQCGSEWEFSFSSIWHRLETIRPFDGCGPAGPRFVGGQFTKLVADGSYKIVVRKTCEAPSGPFPRGTPVYTIVEETGTETETTTVVDFDLRCCPEGGIDRVSVYSTPSTTRRIVSGIVPSTIGCGLPYMPGVPFPARWANILTGPGCHGDDSFEYQCQSQFDGELCYLGTPAFDRTRWDYTHDCSSGVYQASHFKRELGSIPGYCHNLAVGCSVFGCNPGELSALSGVVDVSHTVESRWRHTLLTPCAEDPCATNAPRAQSVLGTSTRTGAVVAGRLTDFALGG